MIKKLSIALILFWVLFIFSNMVFSEGLPESAKDVCPVKVGSQIPSITVAGLDGKPLDLSAKLQRKSSVLVFYRGGWCPYCNTQLAGLQKIEDELTETHQIIAISPDRPAELKKSVKKETLNYTLLSDSTGVAATKMGIAYKVSDDTYQKLTGAGIDLEAASGMDHHVLPVPAVFLVDKTGTIQFKYVNPDYKVRLDEDILLVLAKALEKEN